MGPKITETDEIARLQERVHQLEQQIKEQGKLEEEWLDNPARTEAWHNFLRERYELIPKDEKNLTLSFNLRDLWTAFASGRKSMLNLKKE